MPSLLQVCSTSLCAGCGAAVTVLQAEMAKKNKSTKPKGKNGTAKAAPEQKRSGSYAAAIIAALLACGAAFVVKSRDPDTAHANAVLACYTTSQTCDVPLPSCGVVTAPSQIASALRANDAVLVAAIKGATTTLVRAAGETPLAMGTNVVHNRAARDGHERGPRSCRSRWARPWSIILPLAMGTKVVPNPAASDGHESGP